MSRISPKTTLLTELIDTISGKNLEKIQRLVETYKSLDQFRDDEDFGILLLESASSEKIFRLVTDRINFSLISDEKKAEYLSTIINNANHEPSPQREAARILIDEVGFNPNNKSALGASNALSAAAEQGDVETTIMVLNCKNRIAGFEEDAVRDLVVFGIRNRLIEVRRDLATPRGAEARGEQTAVQKLLGNRERMEGLQRAKKEADRQIAEKSADAARGGGGGGGGGGRYALPASPATTSRSGSAVDVTMSPTTAASSPSRRVRPAHTGDTVSRVAEDAPGCCRVA